MCFPIERAECGTRGRLGDASNPCSHSATRNGLPHFLRMYDQRPIGRYVKICTLTPLCCALLITFVTSAEGFLSKGRPETSVLWLEPPVGAASPVDPAY